MKNSEIWNFSKFFCNFFLFFAVSNWPPVISCKNENDDDDDEGWCCYWWCVKCVVCLCDDDFGIDWNL